MTTSESLPSAEQIFWAKKPIWDNQEFIALAVGLSPKTRSGLLAFWNDPLDVQEQVTFLRDLISRSVKKGELNEDNTPRVWKKWAERHDRIIPTGLAIAIDQYSPPDVGLEGEERTSDENERLRERLKELQKELRRCRESSLSQRLNMAQEILYAVAVQKYHLEPGGLNRVSAAIASDVFSATTREMDYTTVRGHLKAGLEFVTQRNPKK